MGTEPKPPNPDEFPNYVHIKHVAKAPADRPKSEGALECDMQHVDFIGDDLLDVLRRRKWWDRRAKKRLKMVTAVRLLEIILVILVILPFRCMLTPSPNPHSSPR